jgi:hypothetical protein
LRFLRVNGTAQFYGIPWLGRSDASSAAVPGSFPAAPLISRFSRRA